MKSEQEILDIATKYVKSINYNEADDYLFIVEEATIRKPYGSIFFYTSKKFYETENIRYALAGNAPFLVDKKNGEITTFGTDLPLEDYILEYEENL